MIPEGSRLSLNFENSFPSANNFIDFAVKSASINNSCK